MNSVNVLGFTLLSCAYDIHERIQEIQSLVQNDIAELQLRSNILL